MKRHSVILLALAAASLIAYLDIAWLSRQFVYGEGHPQRPIVEVLGLFAVAFACYLGAIATAVRCPPGRGLLAWIVVPAVLFRLALLFSTPIQEVDIYRYLWDGAASHAGVSPFRYSPEQVLSAGTHDPLPRDLRRLVELRDSSSAMATILQRVHFGELPTIYPPVSQLVFGVASVLTPRQASVWGHVVVLKSVLLVFDLATLALVIVLLRFAGRHLGWSIAYGWCPLLMKEVANSGHLDAIAVFLCTLAVYLAVKGLFGSVVGSQGRSPAFLTWMLNLLQCDKELRIEKSRASFRVAGARWPLLATSALTLALGVGAKIFPIVLAPLLLITCLRRLGWAQTVLATTVFVATTLVVLWPMLPTSPAEQSPNGPADPSLGLKTFVRRWEMNDFLFLFVVENVKPTADVPHAQRPWFVAVPESWRYRISNAAAQAVGADPWEAGFLLARLLTGGAFVVLAVVLAIRPRPDPADWLRVAFLTVAWFWLLSPTQNPWYWTWALPLLPFARGRAWFALSGLALLYYLRFWLSYQWPNTPVPGSRYAGQLYFDFVVTWVEYLPWFLWLAAAWLIPKSFNRSPTGRAKRQRSDHDALRAGRWPSG